MTTKATFIIPIGPYHIDIAQRAIESAQLQTVPSTVIYVHDHDGKGPSWARNRGLEQCKSEFVVFLDADDWVEPTFVERCLSVWQPGRYVYTDWAKEDGATVSAYEEPWCEDLQWHPITALLPRAAVDEVGGFDDLPGGEDTEFYWALTRRVRCCPLVLHEPLFHYSNQGQRSKTWLGITDQQGPVDFTGNANYTAHMQLVQGRYGQMGCCRDQATVVSNDYLPDGVGVLARATWGGNKPVIGRATGTRYPRTGNGAHLYVHPEDIKAMPTMFRAVEEVAPAPVQAPEPVKPTVIKANGFQEVVAALFDIEKPPPTLAQLQAVERAESAPDIAGITDKARRAYD